MSPRVKVVEEIESLGASPGAIDPEQSAGERLGCPECCVDSRRLADEVRIKCADDDAGVVGAFVVEANEVLAIEREQDPSFRAGERENLVVRHGLAGFPRIHNGQGLVAQPTQFQYDRQREILVGVESRHGSGGLVLLDLAVDLVPMGARVSPCVHEILGPEGRIAA